LKGLLEDATAGDPIRGTKWTLKSLRKLAKALRGRGFKIGYESVGRLLKGLGYSLRVNRKCLSKRRDPERDEQMRYLARQRQAFMKAGKPAISVDTKKKEQIGAFKNPGKTWRQEPKQVLVTDFPSDADGKAIPYGVYDMTRNRGFVVVGVSHETAEFAVNAIGRWWQQEGQDNYPDATELLIQADSGGVNSRRSWLFKWELQKFADETGLTITITHYPTGASKWNWIEHRLFNHISQNWQGEPLITFETVLKFIRTTKTDAGLSCAAYLDKKTYVTGLKLTSEQKQSINLKLHTSLPKFNCTIKPRKLP
jgi:hypothetical protein